MEHLRGPTESKIDIAAEAAKWRERFKEEATMSLEETEINVGGVSFKGVYIAVFLTALGTISGGIWAASEFYSRVGAMEEAIAETAGEIPDVAPLAERLSVLEDRLNSMTVPDITNLETNMSATMEAVSTLKVDIARIQIPDLTPIETQIREIEVQLRDNNIGQLQGKLTELSTSLANMMEQVRTLTELRDDVADAKSAVADGNAKIVSMELQVNSALRFAEDVKRLQTEVEDLWNGMDALANPLN